MSLSLSIDAADLRSDFSASADFSSPSLADFSPSAASSFSLSAFSDSSLLSSASFGAVFASVSSAGSASLPSS